MFKRLLTHWLNHGKIYNGLVEVNSFSDDCYIKTYIIVSGIPEFGDGETGESDAAAGSGYREYDIR